MTINTGDLYELAKLTLIACDQAYKGDGLAPNAALAPLDDTPQYRDVAGRQPQPPFGEGFLLDAGGFKVAQTIEDSGSGFKSVIYRNTATNETIVAFAGVDGPNFKDWSETSKLGWDQWTRGRQRVFQVLDLVASSGKIHFTGQSLKRKQRFCSGRA